MQYAIVRDNDEYLEHFGVKGQKHGERRYQNPDGSLTPEGREHYGVGNGRDARYQNPDGSLTNNGRARLVRSQRYVDAKQKTAGQRVRRTLGAGLVGGLIPGLAGAAGVTGGTLAALAAKGYSLAGLTAGSVGSLAASGAVVAAPLIAAGALGGLAIAGIKHGVQAAKVRRGQNFIDKFGLPK